MNPINLNKIESFVDDYLRWLKTQIKPYNLDFNSEGYAVISTPFLDVHNDHIEIYIKKDKNKIILSDDAYTINNLELSGLNMTPKREELIKGICKRHGLICDGPEISKTTSIDNFTSSFHSIIQTILAVNDLNLVRQDKVSDFFLEDVKEYLDRNHINYIESINVTGESSLNHNFDFAFQKTDKTPERFCNVIKNPTSSIIKTMIFGWNDTKKSRKNESEWIVVLNDSKQISEEVLNALGTYEAKTVLWSERENNLKLFKA